jgi:Peptidase family M28
MKKKLIFVLSFLSFLQVIAQTPHKHYNPITPQIPEIDSVYALQKITQRNSTDLSQAQTFLNSISLEYLKKTTDTLSSHTFKGRHSVNIGGKRAARYLATELFYMGVPYTIGDTSYFQSIPMESEKWSKPQFDYFHYDTKINKEYFAPLSSNKSIKRMVFNEIIFIGYGIDDKKYSDYKKKAKSLKGKCVAFYVGEPTNEKGRSYITNSKEMSEWTTDWQKKLKTAKKYGVSMVLIIDRNARKFMLEHELELNSKYSHLVGDEPHYVNNFYISPKLSEKLFGDNYAEVVNLKAKIDADGKPRRLMHGDAYLTLGLKKQRHEEEAVNVVMKIEGKDKSAEPIMLTANYDNLGQKSDTTIYHGANGNASGIAVLMSLYKTFYSATKSGWKPKRTIIFVGTSGRNQRFAGAEYLAANSVSGNISPAYIINLDRIGTIDSARMVDKSNYAYINYGDSTDTKLEGIFSAAANSSNNEIFLSRLKIAKESSPFFNTELTPFYDKGLKCIYLTTGNHQNYGTIDDKSTDINYQLLHNFAKFTFLTLWQMSNE